MLLWMFSVMIKLNLPNDFDKKNERIRWVAMVQEIGTGGIQS